MRWRETHTNTYRQRQTERSPVDIPRLPGKIGSSRLTSLGLQHDGRMKQLELINKSRIAAHVCFSPNILLQLNLRTGRPCKFYYHQNVVALAGTCRLFVVALPHKCVGKSAGLVIERLRVRILAGAVGEFFFPRFNFPC